MRRAAPPAAPRTRWGDAARGGSVPRVELGMSAQSDDVPPADPVQVLCDERLIDALAAGRLPAHDPLTVALATWRDACRGGDEIPAP
jgi:hypothetical protein